MGRRRMMMQSGGDGEYKWLKSLDTSGRVLTDIAMPLGTTFEFKIRVPAGKNASGGVHDTWPKRKGYDAFVSGVYGEYIITCIDGDSTAPSKWNGLVARLDNTIENEIVYNSANKSIKVNGITPQIIESPNGSKLSSTSFIRLLYGGQNGAHEIAYWIVRDANGVLLNNLRPYKQRGICGVKDKVTGKFHEGVGNLIVHN